MAPARAPAHAAGSERRKQVVLAAYEFQGHVGHLLIPVALWLVQAAPFAGVAGGASSRRT